MIIKNGKVFIDGEFHQVDIRIANGKINEIKPELDNDEVFDAAGNYIFPGFIDTHFHGACKVNCGDSVESMQEICRTIPQYGITSFVPTPMASDDEVNINRIRTIRASKGARGADILGMFLYTQYKNRSISYYPPGINPTKEHTLKIADNDLSDIIGILVAPELEGGLEWISWVRSQGVIPVIGFSEGTGEQLSEAVKRGATLTDHFPNGFPTIDHHMSQAVTQCLMEDDLYMQLNCDCIHVSVEYIKMMLELKGEDHIISVSDSSQLLGMPEGEYDMGDKKVYLKDGAVRDINGKLVTGAHTYDENMRTMYANGFSLETLGKIFAENVSTALSLSDRGKIEKGRRADLVIMNENLDVMNTMIQGEWVFTKAP